MALAHPWIPIEQWAELPEDDDRELVDGTLVAGEMPSSVHEAVLVWLTRLLAGWASTCGARVFGAGLRFAVSPTRGRMPDLTVFFAGRPRPPQTGASHRPPSIAVEVVSPSPADERRDRVEKLEEYARFGVSYYWIVDPELRTFEILELDDGGHYRHLVGMTDGVVDPVPGCPALSLDVAALWREIDGLLAEA
jgi:Uma2 family endonuclease